MSEIRIMSYNICKYCFDKQPPGFPPDIIDEKISNLKEMLMEYHPDLIGLQEDWEFVDKDSTRKSVNAVFRPIWTGSGTGRCTLRYKPIYPRTAQKLVEYPTGRCYRRAFFTVDGKRLLFISTHPSPFAGAENVKKRKTEYTQLFNDIKALRWTYCVVTGDMNTANKADKENLKALCEENGFGMTIGTYMPWITTCMGHDGTGHMSYDNILYSSNITIKSVKALREWYDRLYSDHVPLIADVILG